jgi:hypothetical protein
VMPWNANGRKHGAIKTAAQGCNLRARYCRVILAQLDHHSVDVKSRPMQHAMRQREAARQHWEGGGGEGATRDDSWREGDLHPSPRAIFRRTDCPAMSSSVERERAGMNHEAAACVSAIVSPLKCGSFAVFTAVRHRFIGHGGIIGCHPGVIASAPLLLPLLLLLLLLLPLLLLLIACVDLRPQQRVKHIRTPKIFSFYAQIQFVIVFPALSLADRSSLEAESI